MGNAITISIVLDYEQQKAQKGMSYAAAAGQPLRGKVIVKVTKKMKGEKVQLVALGKESVRQKKMISDKPFLHMNATLQDLRGKTVKRGTYIYPFCINLPESMPTSMYFGTGSTEGKIVYKIAANFGSARLERYFQVASKPLLPIAVPCFIEPKTEAIKSMGIRTVGSVTFGVMVQDTHVGRDTDLQLAIACRNDSSVDIGRVEAKLVELITLKSKHGEFTHKNTLMQCNDLALPGLLKDKASREALNQRRKSATNLQDTNHAAIYESLLSSQNTIQIAIPKSARDTYAGGIVKVEHYLKIKLQTSTYFTDNLSAKIPLKIGYPPEEGSYEILPEPEIHTVPQEDVRPLATPIEVVSPDDNIPFAAAVPVAPPEQEEEQGDAFVAPPVEATAQMYNATAPVEREEEDEQAEDTEATTAEGNEGLHVMQEGEEDEYAAPSAPAASDGPPSLETLLNEMSSSINDYDIIRSKIGAPGWSQVYANLTPTEFGSIIAHVNSDFDQPRIATLVSGEVGRFTCEHCVQALKNTASWNRPAMVKALLTRCVDLFTKSETIKKELSLWERTVTAGDFRRAIPSYQSTVF